MTFQDLQFALELNCISEKDIDYILDYSKKNGIDTQAIDDELLKLGYDRVFDNDLDDDDDDDFGYIEKFPQKSKFYED